jgi:hypothetical protein
MGKQASGIGSSEAPPCVAFAPWLVAPPGPLELAPLPASPTPLPASPAPRLRVVPPHDSEWIMIRPPANDSATRIGGMLQA